MDLELKGKIVVVTGGNAGIGYACAQRYVEEGARVVIVARNAERLEHAREKLAASGGNVLAMAANLSDGGDAERVVAEIENSFGAVDVLVNCAGAARRVDYRELDETAWRDGFESKFMPYMNMCTVILRRHAAKRAERPEHASTLAIVNVIGKGGRVPTSTHLPGGAANAALMLATAGLAQAWGAAGVRVNAVSPASITTERLTRRYGVLSEQNGRSVDALMNEAASEIPVGRFGTPREVAEAVLFLSSARASYLLGSHLVMDGGLRPLI